MIYTSGWTREKVRTEADYQKWLSSLKDGDLVVLQLFKPASDRVASFPFDRWMFEVHRLEGNQIATHGGSKPIDRGQGYTVFWDDTEKPSGEVFPNRLVPLSSDLGIKDFGDYVIGHAPVYEPHWMYQRKCYYMIDRNMTQIQRVPYSYRKDCDGGYLLIAFMDDPIEIPGCQFLYSEYLQG